MSEGPDHPKVIVFPPILFLATIMLGASLQWLLPLGVLAAIQPIWRITAGAFLLAAGLLLPIAGRNALVRHGTNVSPLRPTTSLVTGGVFGWTRNPLYTGGTLIMAGLALIFALDWLMLLIVPSALILHFGVVLREEHYLEQKFKNEYRQYRARVSRYGWPI
jgi:protein-S-isoprenylcysteine O-methyltransferase Ste14